MGERGVKMNPRGPVTAGDLRSLVARLDQEQISNNALAEFTTPLTGDRRAVTIAVIDHEPANMITVGAVGDYPAADTTTNPNG